MATCILASSLAFVDGSVVNVGLAAIGADFHGGAGDLQWVINAYLLPLGALLLLGGAAGDRLGRRRLLVWGTVLFAAASVGCVLAPSLPWLLAARFVQGMGSAILMPNSLAILGASFEGEAKGRAVGIWASVGAAMAAIGPVLGGWLIDTVGWRSIFLINLPLALGAIVLGLLFVREVLPERAPPPLDVTGGVLATAGLGTLTWSLTIGSGPAGWTPMAYGLLAAGGVLMLAFLLVEKSRKSRAMIPLNMFGSPPFVGLTLLTLLLYGALGALMVLVPYLLIRASGYSGTQAGSALLPFAVILAIASPRIGALAGRIGSRWLLICGPLVVAAGFLLLLRVDQHSSYWTALFPAIVVMAVGMACAVSPLTTAVLSSVDGSHTGSASGLNSAVARIAGMIATALLGNILAMTGPGLVQGFHIASLACAVACAGAGVSIFLLFTANAKKA